MAGRAPAVPQWSSVDVPRRRAGPRADDDRRRSGDLVATPDQPVLVAAGRPPGSPGTSATSSTSAIGMSRSAASRSAGGTTCSSAGRCWRSRPVGCFAATTGCWSARCSALLSLRSLSRLFLHVPPDVAGYGVTNRFLPISDDRWWRMSRGRVRMGLVGDDAAGAGERRRPLEELESTRSADAVTCLVRRGRVGGGGDLRLRGRVERRNPGTSPGCRSSMSVVGPCAVVAVALAVGLIRLRSTRSAVVDLVAELGHDARAGAARRCVRSRAGRCRASPFCRGRSPRVATWMRPAGQSTCRSISPTGR